jgi:hypothetical protein
LGNPHTNTLESFWSKSKNGIWIVYHSAPTEYLQHYLDEYAFHFDHQNDITLSFSREAFGNIGGVSFFNAYRKSSFVKGPSSFVLAFL